MQKDLTYILDIGSSSLRLYAVAKLYKNPIVVTEEKVLYDGFLDGEFLSPQKMEANLSQIITEMKGKLKTPISKVIVGVPSDFCICVCKRISRKFASIHKITNEDINELYESNLDFGDSKEYEVISFSPMQYVLDNSFKTLEPVNKKSISVSVDASYVLAKKNFIEFITKSFNNVGVKNVEYISTALGQATACASQFGVNKPIAVVDCGHITTSVCVLKGEGLAMMTSFSMGGGHISSDLMQLLNLKFADAEMLKRKVLLTIDSDKNDNYELCVKGRLVKAPINATNQIVSSRIEMLGKVIDDVLSIDEVYNDLTIYLTGDGIANFKGVKTILEETIGRKVKLFTIPFDNTNEKFQTSKLGLTTLSEIIV